MTQATIKENRLNIRCDTYARQMLDKAAAYAHISISEFVLTHAISSAELVIKEHESITLTLKKATKILLRSMRQ